LFAPARDVHTHGAAFVISSAWHLRKAGEDAARVAAPPSVQEGGRIVCCGRTPSWRSETEFMMRVSSSDPSLYLLDPNDLAGDGLPDEVRIHQACVEEVARWARGYLCQPHPALGREGPVCPYTEHSLERSLFWITVSARPNPTREELSAIVIRYREWFVKLEPVKGKEAEYKTIVILLPNLGTAQIPDLIDEVQAVLRPAFIAQGLMIGQFHSGCEEPGLWNRDFRPLQSTVPLLAIRYMVRTDAAFMTRDARSLATYLRRFGRDVPGRLQPMVRQAALAFGLEYPEPAPLSTDEPASTRMIAHAGDPAASHRRRDR
jgi:hypothetical protein